MLDEVIVHENGMGIDEVNGGQDDNMPVANDGSQVNQDDAITAEASYVGTLGDAGETAVAAVEVGDGSPATGDSAEFFAEAAAEGQDAWIATLEGDALAEAMQEVVIGPDDRIRITGTTSYPWRAICSLRITAGDDSQWIGTGWLVGPRTVITAGHCVFIHNNGGWAKRIEVIPGRNGAQQPYASCVATSFRSVVGWTQNRKRSHDYGAIILPSNCRYGDQVGYFGYANYSDSTLEDMLVNLSGYPGDKPVGTQWFHYRRITEVDDRVLTYDIDTAGGQSGAPVWRYINGQRYAVGIHTNGHSSGNSATRIAKPVFDNIKAWKAQGS
ncbi:MAG: serine protease [Anaerolineae bacterium]|nr:serine protease [Anaerolineae bacterium]